MHNLEDNLIIESFRIPWLIWIQLLILLLIILLLSYSVDLPPTASSPPEPLSSAALVTDDARSCSQELNHEAQEQRPTESRDRESNTEENASSMKDLQRLFHPCYYIEIAKQAFLQCLGLGYPPSNSRERRHDE